MSNKTNVGLITHFTLDQRSTESTVVANTLLTEKHVLMSIVYRKVRVNKIHKFFSHFMLYTV